MNEYDYSVALITVTDIESAAVTMMYDKWRKISSPMDEQDYFVTSFCREGASAPHKLVWAKQNEQGMTAAATLSMKVIAQFRPMYLIMVGIAAGVACDSAVEQLYGDIIAADMIWNYSVGKFVSPGGANIRYGNLGFVSRPTMVIIDSDVREAIAMAAASPENQCVVHIGPMACGNAVVANKEILTKQVYSQFRNTLGLDMESYGVAYAAANAPAPRPKAIVLKSICDFADEQKCDQYQKFAAYTSCEFAKLLYEKFLPMDGV